MIIHGGRPLFDRFEAGRVLQRYMPAKDALQWLEKDRERDPLLQYEVLNGQAFYRPTDLQHFVVQHIYPHAQIDFGLRRAGEDRRVHVDRRRNPLRVLGPLVERRHYDRPDRRGTMPDRRSRAQ
jgi:hypothetical protein